MRDDQAAEWILSLLVTREHASCAVGDLLEEHAGRGRAWFWKSVARTALSFWWRNLVTAPLRIISFVLLGWLVYMTVSIILVAGGIVLAPLFWPVADFVTRHTGLELVVNLFGIDAPLPRLLVSHWIELLAMLAVAPFLVGRLAARCWPERKATAWLTAVMVWPVLAGVVPFVAISAKVSLHMMPLIQAVVLAGLLSERRHSTVPSGVDRTSEGQ